MVFDRSEREQSPMYLKELNRNTVLARAVDVLMARVLVELY